MPIDNDEEKTINRRSVLQKAGAAGVAGVGFASLGSGTASAACRFRYQIGDCVVVNQDTEIHPAPCDPNAIAPVLQGTLGYVMDLQCCGPNNEQAFYFIEWCNPDIEPGWVHQQYLDASDECCCTFEYQIEQCVETGDDVIIFEDPCAQQEITHVPIGIPGYIVDRRCCEDNQPYYLIDWCDPNLPDGWVHEGQLVPSDLCC